MVDLNATAIPILGPIGSLINAIKVLVGGVFGIYLIILYIRYKEYTLLRRMYREFRELREETRSIAKKQHIRLEPIKESKLGIIKDKIKEKIEERRLNKGSKKK
ncbi:hypothetical protein KY349_03070 [Candidatus Woesearchaeota archaeon]|nr:hypothetical protein [Candidatus Woesearchaeota archaeon]